MTDEPNDSSTDKLSDYYQLVSLITHEAGHTIFGLLHLYKIDSVQISPGTESYEAGVTNYICPEATQFSDPDVFIFMMNSEIAIKYAGQIA